MTVISCFCLLVLCLVALARADGWWGCTVEKHPKAGKTVSLSLKKAVPDDDFTKVYIHFYYACDVSSVQKPKYKLRFAGDTILEFELKDNKMIATLSQNKIQVEQKTANNISFTIVPINNCYIGQVIQVNANKRVKRLTISVLPYWMQGSLTFTNAIQGNLEHIEVRASTKVTWCISVEPTLQLKGSINPRPKMSRTWTQVVNEAVGGNVRYVYFTSPDGNYPDFADMPISMQIIIEVNILNDDMGPFEFQLLNRESIVKVQMKCEELKLWAYTKNKATAMELVKYLESPVLGPCNISSYELELGRRIVIYFATENQRLTITVFPIESQGHLQLDGIITSPFITLWTDWSRAKRPWQASITLAQKTVAKTDLS